MAFEVAVVWVIAVIFVTALCVVGGPIARAIAQKFQYKYRDLGSEAETKLKTRVEFLESELQAVKQQLTDLQQTVDFAIKSSGSVQADRENISIKVEKK